MKAGWKIGQLSDVLDRGSSSLTLKKVRSSNGIYPVFGAKGQVGTTSEYQESETFLSVIKDGAGIGRVAINPPKSSVLGTLQILRPRAGYDPKFLFYYLESIGLAEKYKTGSTIPHIYYKDYKSEPAPLISLEEQKRIVAVLDEAFAALDRARKNIEANLTDALGFYLSASRSIFSEESQKYECEEKDHASISNKETPKPKQAKGRAATLRPIKGDYSLSVLCGEQSVRKGWMRSQLSDLARLESGHTPSRKKVDYWNGDIKWMGIKDARANHGSTIMSTLECATQLGIDNSSARILPEHTVCLSRTASVGYVTKTGVPLATSQDFVNWICGDKLDPDFLMCVLLAQGDELKRFSSGSVHQTIYFPEVKAFTIAHPPISIQKEIVSFLEQVREKSDQLVTVYEAQLADVEKLRYSLLQHAFSGGVTTAPQNNAVNDNDRDERLSAATLVLAYDKHCLEQQQKTFGHVKAQKTLHLTESIAGLDLGRQPRVRQAGPHDQAHFNRVEAWAAENDIFKFQQRRRGGQLGYKFVQGKHYRSFLTEAKMLLADHQASLSRFLPLITAMNTEDTEVFTTVYAAWNNLLADGKAPSDDEIIFAAREGWHESKTSIARSKFSNAIRTIRQNNLTPDGTAKYVHSAQESLI